MRRHGRRHGEREVAGRERRARRRIDVDLQLDANLSGSVPLEGQVQQQNLADGVGLQERLLDRRLGPGLVLHLERNAFLRTVLPNGLQVALPAEARIGMLEQEVEVLRKAVEPADDAQTGAAVKHSLCEQTRPREARQYIVLHQLLQDVLLLDHVRRRVVADSRAQYPIQHGRRLPSTPRDTHARAGCGCCPESPPSLRRRATADRPLRCGATRSGSRGHSGSR